MNGFKCNVTNSVSNVALAQSKVPRRCGSDSENSKLESSPANCTYGAKTPFYWFNLEKNNMFEGTYAPPVYNDLYNFRDGAQDDIFVDSYVSIPDPAPNAALPVLANTGATPTTGLPPIDVPSNSSAAPASTPSVDCLSDESPELSVSRRSLGSDYQRELRGSRPGRFLGFGGRLQAKHRNRDKNVW